MIALPDDKPVTMPEGDTVAKVGASLLHVPPLPVVVNAVVVPIHIELLPVMVPGTGSAFTTTI